MQIVQFCQMKITAWSRLHSGFLSVLLWCHVLYIWCHTFLLNYYFEPTANVNQNAFHGDFQLTWSNSTNKKQTLHGDACTHRFVHEQTAVRKEVFSQSVRCRTRAVIQTSVIPRYFPGGLESSKLGGNGVALWVDFFIRKKLHATHCV